MQLIGFKEKEKPTILTSVYRFGVRFQPRFVVFYLVVGVGLGLGNALPHRRPQLSPYSCTGRRGHHVQPRRHTRHSPRVAPPPHSPLAHTLHSRLHRGTATTASHAWFTGLGIRVTKRRGVVEWRWALLTTGLCWATVGKGTCAWTGVSGRRMLRLLGMNDSSVRFGGRTKHQTDNRRSKRQKTEAKLKSRHFGLVWVRPLVFLVKCAHPELDSVSERCLLDAAQSPIIRLSTHEAWRCLRSPWLHASVIARRLISSATVLLLG